MKEARAMTILMPHIAARLFGEPLLIDPGKLAAIVLGLGGRIVEGGINLSPDLVAIDHVAFRGGRPSDAVMANAVRGAALGRVGDPLGNAYERRGVGDRLVPRVGNVGVIAVEGTLVHKGKFVGQSSGETSYEGLQAQIARATRDDSIKGVVLEVDSFGGEAAGAFETAGMIRELSAAKPTLAILTDFALSAGYLMASQARQVVMGETGVAGSIGAVTMHYDMSRRLAENGVTVTVIASGAHKADGNSFAPLPDEVRGAIQARLDRSREIFAQAVEAGRGKRLDRVAALATEAEIYHGEDAVKAGLVDGLIDPQRAFKAFVDRIS